MAAKAAKAKPVVDHSDLSGVPPKNPESTMISDMAATLAGAGIDVERGEPAPAPAPAALPVKVDDAFGDVETGRKFTPPKMIVYGIDGVGKSSFAAQAPDPIFIPTEIGLNQIGATRMPLATTYSELVERLTRVANKPHAYQTVVLDTLSGAEKLIYDKVARDNGKENIDLVGGGFDKGQKLALTQWQEVVALLDRCWNRGMAVLVIAHARTEKLGDPENPMVEQFAPALHKKTSGELFRRWADATLFLTRRMSVRKEGQGIMEKQIAVPVGADGGERIIRTAWTPTAVAKNRYEMPIELPLPKNGGWDEVMKHIQAFYQS